MVYSNTIWFKWSFDWSKPEAGYELAGSNFCKYHRQALIEKLEACSDELKPLIYQFKSEKFNFFHRKTLLFFSQKLYASKLTTKDLSQFFY